MRAEEYLGKFRLIISQVNVRLQEIEALRSQLIMPASGLHERVQSSPDDKMPAIIAQIMELEDEIIKDIEEQGCHLDDLNSVLEEITDPKCIKFIQERYILGKSTEEAAFTMDYSERAGYDIRKEAIKQVQEILDRRSNGGSIHKKRRKQKAV